MIYLGSIPMFILFEFRTVFCADDMDILKPDPEDREICGVIVLTLLLSILSLELTISCL